MADEDWAPPEPTPLERATDTSPRRESVEVPGYEELTEVARGGDSIVYRARQASLDRDVAIKVIQVADPAAAARFQRELAITVRLGRAHPHIVTVLDTTTTTGGLPCLVMDFHDLGSLHDRLLDHGPLPVSEVVEAGTAVADALAFAHAAGVLHRDVKPQNVLLLPTSYVLSDFGIARMADAGHTASLERFSYRHASPQVLDGLAPTVADDVWSLGSTLFTLLDGRAPFAADDPDEDTALAYLRRVRTGQRRPLRRDDLPADLRDLVDGCLEADPQHRVPTAELALARLRSLRTEGRSWDPIAAPAPITGSAPAANPATASESPAAPAAMAAAAEPGTTSPAVEPPAASAASADLADLADPADPGNPDNPALLEPSAPTAPPPAAALGPSAPESSALEHSAPGPAAATARPPALTGPPPAVAREGTAPAASPTTSPEPAASAPAPGGQAASVPVVASGAAPVARSALADLAGGAGSAGAADAEETGLFPASGPADPSNSSNSSTRPDATGDDAAPPGTATTGAGWRRIAAFVGGMLLAGAAVGVGASLLSGDEAPEVPATPTAAPVPTASDPVPAQTGPPQASISDPDLAPRGLVVAGQGTSALLTWAPPNGSIDFLVVVRLVDGEVDEAIANLPSEAREYTIEGLDPDAPACFAVVGYGRSGGELQAGSTAEECTG